MMRPSRAHVVRAATRALSTAKPPPPMSTKAVMIAEEELMGGRAELEAQKSEAQKRVEAMAKVDPSMVAGNVEDDDPDWELPENPAEVGVLDPSFRADRIQPDGQRRMVTIRQPAALSTQSATESEEKWIFDFMDHDELQNTWDNPLMGWVSGSDNMASQQQGQFAFRTASEAVNFAKKSGLKYIVEPPIIRIGRDDDAQYQDNFLPQDVAALVQRDRTQCNHWERQSSGTSHYMRPLKYHGDGEVPQFGPNGEEKVAKHVPAYYKSR